MLSNDDRLTLLQIERQLQEDRAVRRRSAANPAAHRRVSDDHRP